MAWSSRRVVAVVVVTTALCADHVAVAAPAAGAESVEIAGLAGRLVSRLTQNLRQAMPVAVRLPVRQGLQSQGLSPFRPEHLQPAALAHCPLSPIQFRLPPPRA